MNIPIKFIGILTLIRHDLLIRLIKSIDWDVDTVVILFQNGYSNFDLNKLKNKFIKQIIVVSSDMNIGVSRGWNYFLKNFNEPYWLIIGDDNYFEKGTLEKISNYINNKKKYDKNFFYGMKLKRKNEVIEAGFHSFILTKNIIDKIGYFDENIYPAYVEDYEYWRRVIIAGIKCHCIKEAYIYSGDEKFSKSCSVNSVEYEYKKKMRKCQLINLIYFIKKWNTEEKTFKYPFNNKNYTIKDEIHHKNYFDNQILLLGHSNKPNFITKTLE